MWKMPKAEIEFNAKTLGKIMLNFKKKISYLVTISEFCEKYWEATKSNEELNQTTTNFLKSF